MEMKMRRANPQHLHHESGADDWYTAMEAISEVIVG